MSRFLSNISRFLVHRVEARYLIRFYAFQKGKKILHIALQCHCQGSEGKVVCLAATKRECGATESRRSRILEKVAGRRGDISVLRSGQGGPVLAVSFVSQTLAAALLLMIEAVC